MDFADSLRKKTEFLSFSSFMSSAVFRDTKHDFGIAKFLLLTKNSFFLEKYFGKYWAFLNKIDFSVDTCISSQ